MVKNVSSVNLIRKTLTPKRKPYSFAQDLINKSGVFTKEDLSRAKLKQINYSSLSKEDIKEKLILLKTSINNMLQNYFSETHSVLNCIIYNDSQIASREVCKKLKSYRLKELVLSNMLISENTQRIKLCSTNLEVPLAGGMNKKNIPFSTSEPLIEHPRNIAAKIVGYQYSEENPLIAKKNLIYKRTSISNLIKEQKRNVNQIIAKILDKGIKQDFIYTNEEIKNLRILIKKYDAITSILLKKGVDMRSIEKFQYFSKFPKDIKAGTILPNSDVVIDTIKIMDLELNKKVPAIITYANTNFGYRFKIYRYDKNLIMQNEKFQELSKKYNSQNQYDKLSLLNKKCENLLRGDEIAEVFMESKNKEHIRENFSDKNLLSDEKLNELWEGGINYIFIRNLKNYDRKRYSNITFPLVKILKNIAETNNLKNIFINALAYNNVKHSPAAMYLKAGCIPISHTEEEIMNMLREDDKGCDKSIFFMYKNKF